MRRDIEGCKKKKKTVWGERKRFTVVNVDKKARTYGRPGKMMDTYCGRRLGGKIPTFFDYSNRYNQLMPWISENFVFKSKMYYTFWIFTFIFLEIRLQTLKFDVWIYIFWHNIFSFAFYLFRIRQKRQKHFLILNVIYSYYFK